MRSVRQANPSQSSVPFPLMTTRRILEEGLDSNVVIICGEGKSVKGHRNFLIASSPVFEKMFSNKMEETKTGRVDMTDLSEEGVRAFLRCLYYGEKPGTDGDLNLAFELLYASHKYEVSKMEEMMINYWLGTPDAKIDLKSALKAYVFVRGIEKASQLKEKMARILHRKYDELKTLPGYKDFFKTPNDSMEFCEDLVKISRA